MNIIADVAGQYDALIRLLQKMPQEKTLFLGDLIDRGPKSREVVELAMRNECVLGNHEHMAIDYHRKSKIYEEDIWMVNGGRATLKSYGGNLSDDHIKWFESLPLFYEGKNFFASHALLFGAFTLEESCELTAPGRGFSEGGRLISAFSLIWNRRFPSDRKFTDGNGGSRDKLQVFGHNSMWGLRRFDREDGSPFAICLDDSRNRLLTGLHIDDETGAAKIYQEHYELTLDTFPIRDINKAPNHGSDEVFR